MGTEYLIFCDDCKEEFSLGKAWFWLAIKNTDEIDEFIAAIKKDEDLGYSPHDWIETAMEILNFINNHSEHRIIVTDEHDETSCYGQFHQHQLDLEWNERERKRNEERKKHSAEDRVVLREWYQRKDGLPIV